MAVTRKNPWPISLIVLAIWVVIVLAGELLQVRDQPTALEELARNQIIFGVLVAALFLIGVISYFRWWPQVAGKGPAHLRDLRLLWLPALALLILLLIVLLVGLPPPHVLVIVIVNTLLAGMFGVWMVPLRICLETIIPLIVIHWLQDCLLFLASFLGGLVILPFAVVLFIYGLWLLRGYRHSPKTAGET